MVFGCIENCDQDLDNAFRVRPFRLNGDVGGGLVAAGQKRPCEIADRGYDDGEVVAAVPEPIVRGLVLEDLVESVSLRIVLLERRDQRTSISPTTIERLGIYHHVVSEHACRIHQSHTALFGRPRF